MSLPWIRFETGFASSPQIEKLADTNNWRAISAFVCGLSWCGMHADMTGVIPTHILKRIHADRKATEAIVGVGLWKPIDDGYLVVNWEKYQGEFLAKRHASKVANCAKWKAQKPDTHRCEICRPEDFGGDPK